MTLATRNTVLILGVALAGLALLAYAVAGYTLILGRYADATFRVGEHQNWFGFRWRVGPLGVYRSLAAAGVLGIVAATGSAISVRLFRRVSSAETYFMILFLISLCAELARIGQPLVELNDLPAFAGVVLTRVILFGRIMGALCLFAAGIYSAGADYPRIGTVTVLFAMLAFLIVYMVPVDSERLNATFIHVTGGREAIDLLLGFLSVGAVVNYVIAWVRGHRERAAAIALAATALVVGKALVCHVPALLPLAIGLALVSVGTATFVLVNRSYYLWY